MSEFYFQASLRRMRAYFKILYYYCSYEQNNKLNIHLNRSNIKANFIYSTNKSI